MSIQSLYIDLLKANGINAELYGANNDHIKYGDNVLTLTTMLSHTGQANIVKLLNQIKSSKDT